MFAFFTAGVEIIRDYNSKHLTLTIDIKAQQEEMNPRQSR